MRKNIKNNFKVRLIFAISIGLFLLISHWIFINYFEKMGRPVEENIAIDLSQGNYSHYGIDSLFLFDERNYLYNLTGWAFSISSVNESTELYNTEIVLYNETQSLVFGAIPQWREDIANAYVDFKIGNTGFDVLINRNMVPKDKFCVGILLTNMEYNTKYFLQTNYIVQNKAFKLHLLQEDNLYCVSIFEKYINN